MVVSARVSLLLGVLGLVACSGPRFSGEPADTDAATGTATSGADSASGTDADGCTIDDPDSCSGSAPYCLDGACTSCAEFSGEATCASIDPETPVCDLPSGRCVECVPGEGQCGAERPYCTGDYACVACIDRADCPDSACNRFTGECMPTDSVYWVRLGDSVGPNPPTPNGEPSSPFLYLQDALDATTAEQITVLIPGGTRVHSTTAVLEGPRTLVMLGNEIDRSRSYSALPLVTMGAGASAQIEGMLVGDQTGAGIECNGGRVWLEDTWIGESTGRAVVGTDCELRVEGGQLWNNRDGGIRLEGDSSLTMHNAVVAFNGHPFEPAVGIDMVGGTFDISYSSIVANYFDDGPASLSCAAGVTGRVRNSLLTAFGPSIACDGLEVSHSVVDTAGLVGEELIIETVDVGGWFVQLEPQWDGLVDPHFADPDGGPMAGLARWGIGDPLVDYDGEPRTGVTGSVGYAGHDRP